MTSWWAELKLAIALMTRLPVGQIATPVPKISAAVWAFPLAGLAVGLCAAAIHTVALAAGLPIPIAAGLALGTQVALTGGLHEDGLADLCDGFWGGRDRDRRLEIMRDSRIGSYGGLALIFSVGLRWAALCAIPDAGAALIVTAMASRTAPVAVLYALAPARDNGLGAAAAQVSGGRLTAALGIGLVGLLVWPQGIAAVVLAALGVAILAMTAKARIGGQTGDVLGASQQIAEIIVLIMLCAH